MKKLFIFIAIAIGGFVLNAKSITKDYIDLLFDKITSTKFIKFDSSRNPFVFQDKKEEIKAQSIGSSDIKTKTINKEYKIQIDAIINKKVIINSKLYGVGDSVMGFKILTITEKWIKVDKDGKTKTINFISDDNEIKITKERD